MWKQEPLLHLQMMMIYTTRFASSHFVTFVSHSQGATVTFCTENSFTPFLSSAAKRMDNLEGKRVSCKIAHLFALRLSFDVALLLKAFVTAYCIYLKILQRVLSTTSRKNLKENSANAV